MSAKDVDPLLRKMDDALAGWTEPAERLRLALSKDELTLYCQPILSLQGGVKFPMAEVLVRLREEEQALLPPGEFLPVFEHYRLMPDLDRWVIREVINRLARGSRIPRFTINISSQSLDEAEFPKTIGLELMSAGVSGSALVFEIDEADSLARLEAATRFSKAVRAVGCGMAVDGFGRRSASFSALRELRVDFVKVDGAITRRLLTNASAETKLRAILRVAEVMGFKTVAEMVEDQDILTRLKALGVTHAQGFGILQPHPIGLVAA